MVCFTCSRVENSQFIFPLSIEKLNILTFLLTSSVQIKTTLLSAANLKMLWPQFDNWHYNNWHISFRKLFTQSLNLTHNTATSDWRPPYFEQKVRRKHLNFEFTGILCIFIDLLSIEIHSLISEFWIWTVLAQIFTPNMVNALFSDCISSLALGV